VTFVPFPTAVLAEHLLGPDQRVAGLLYALTAGVAWLSATACLIVSGLLAVYFALPPRWWHSA
jgi:hypothetical protein